MVKTAAQKAARKEKRKEKKAKLKALGKPINKKVKKKKHVTTVAPVKVVIKDRVSSVPGKSTINLTSHVVCTGLQRERICLISGSSAFTNVTFSGVTGLYLNAGNVAMHKRGSVWATIYDKFRVKRMHFEYKTSAYSANATGASAGHVYMVVSYDSKAPVFADSSEATEYDGCVDLVDYNNAVCKVKASTSYTAGFDSERNYFINNSDNLSLPSGSTNDSVHDYNPGTFQIMTEGNAVTTTIGELWVVYEYEFLVPKAPLYTNPGPLVSKYSGTSTTAVTFATTSKKTGSTNQLTVTFPTTNTLTVTSNPPLVGHILYLTLMQHAATSITVGNIVSGTSTTAANLWISDTVPGILAVDNSGGTSTYNTTLYTASSTTGIWNFTMTTGTIVGATTFDLILTVLPLPLVTITETKEQALERRLKMMEEKFARLTVLTENDDEHFVDEVLPPQPPSSGRTLRS